MVLYNMPSGIFANIHLLLKCVCMYVCVWGGAFIRYHAAVGD